MDTFYLQRHFARIGARAAVRFLDRPVSGGVSLDIAEDREGELFVVRVARGAEPELLVLNAEPRLRHLVLMARGDDGQKSKFLCGHDERHWFVAAVPEKRPVSTVRTAMEALKPQLVAAREVQRRVRPKDRFRRRNEAFVRQGEWFFVPVPNGSAFVPGQVLRDEPIRRGRGKPHWVEFLTRLGGETVYVSNEHPQGLDERQYRRLIGEPKAAHLRWRVMRRNMRVCVRGRVRHPDHATIHLEGWHEVLMNTENEASAMRHVAFLD
jgi:hypothetical protein